MKHPSHVSPFAVRRSVLTMLHRANASHLGSNMSAIEMLITIYCNVDCDKIRNQTIDRSRVLISKGHCAAATYATLAHFSILPMNLLDSYHMEGTRLTGHVNHCVDGVEHSTGALGHGINVAVGCALGLRSRGYSNRPVFALLGDGEIQEGSVWEALMLAVSLKLGNLVILIDNNRISSITKTEMVINMNPLSARFEGFGLYVQEIDGHDVDAINIAIRKALGSGRVGVVICNTVKGRDVPFAEWQPIWHYKSMNDEQYAEAMDHLIRLEEEV